MRLFSQEFVRLYAVSETKKSGKHRLEAFKGNMKPFNEAVDKEELGETLVDLAEALWGESGCRYYEITNEMAPNEYGRLHIYDNDARFEFRDIVSKIDADPMKSQFFVLVNADLTDRCWAVAQSEGTIYSD